MVVSWDKGPSSSPGNQGVRGPQAGCFGSWFLLGVVVDCSTALGMPTAAALSPSPLVLRLPLQERGLLGGSDQAASAGLNPLCSSDHGQVSLGYEASSRLPVLFPSGVEWGLPLRPSGKDVVLFLEKNDRGRLSQIAVFLLPGASLWPMKRGWCPLCHF